jgi:uncharacterized repeat protein (TIGR01451 family)
LAATGLGFGAATSWGLQAGAQTATPSVVQAEGDAYAVYGEASLVGNAPIHVGPVSQTQAYVPPNAVQHAAASAVNCNNAVGPNCIDPLVDGINVLQSNADAGKQQLTTTCNGAPTGFGGDKITGGNACVTIASIAALNANTPQQPQDQLFASAVTAEAQMQGCDDKKALGKVEIANLTIGGTEIVGPAGLDLTPPPNTVIGLGIITVILNEQHYDNQGHGFTVNAIHVFTSPSDLGSLADVDLVIGHAHAEDMCDTGTVTTPPSNPMSSGQNLPVGTKLDSTKHADPGEVVTYTLTITTNMCTVLSVTDFLPSGFQYVPGSASGDLGKDPTVTQSSSNPAIQQLEFFNPAGWTAAKLVETLKAKVPDDAAPGDYVNNVEGESSPSSSNPSIACGSFVFSDTLPVNGSVPANNGNNPGIIVPRPGTGTPTPTASATATPATPTNAVQPLSTVATPNTAGSSAAGWATPLGLLAMLGGLAALRRRTRGRSAR